jgi:hypothetical protein
MDNVSRTTVLSQGNLSRGDVKKHESEKNTIKYEISSLGPELQDVMHGSEGRGKRFSYGVLLEKESDFSIGGKPPEDYPRECVHPILDGNDL